MHASSVFTGRLTLISIPGLPCQIHKASASVRDDIQILCLIGPLQEIDIQLLSRSSATLKKSRISHWPDMSTTSKHPASSKPVYANYASEKIVQGAGVAIFHLASERVVVCYHTRDEYWFLPKGRRNVGESIEEAACREGFEEVSY